MKSLRVTAAGAALLLALTACSGDDADATSTTVGAAVTTLPAAATGTTAETDTTVSGGDSVPSSTDTSTTEVTTTTEAPGASLPEYEIVSREEGSDGDTVVILLDPTSYTSLSDIDVREVINDVYDRFPPVLVAFVVDTEEAAGYVLLESPDADQQAHLDLHYFARLEDGVRIIFQGPLSESGVAILGS